MDEPPMIRELSRYPGYGFRQDGVILTRKQRGRWGKLLDTWRPLKAHLNPRTGYLAVNLTNDEGHADTRTVHVLICEAFHGPRPQGQDCRHLDGNRLNNSASNLIWGSRSENMRDAIGHGTFVMGDRHHNFKVGDAKVAEIFRLRQSGLTQRAIGTRVGLSQGHVKDILLGRRRRHSAGVPR